VSTSAGSAPPTLHVTADEVVLRLARVQDLFGAPSLPGFEDAADLPSGIERLLTKLVAQREPSHHRPVIVVADQPLTATLEAELRAAVVAYCDARRDDVDDHRVALRHDGVQALAIGVPLLLASLLATAVVVHSGLPSFWRTFLTGVLVVVDWVALWYPLDTLLWYGRPWQRERTVLAHVAASLVVRGPDG
jgi:hypothetical protein